MLRNLPAFLVRVTQRVPITSKTAASTQRINRALSTLSQQPRYPSVTAPTNARNHDNPVIPPQHQSMHPARPVLNAWQTTAIQALINEQKNCPETPIYSLGKIHGIEILAKDERAFPSKNLKHRLARALLLRALRLGLINKNTCLFEASSGGTAYSEAYFAKLLGLSYTAVLAKGTPQSKLDAIKKQGGFVVECEPGQDIATATELGKQSGCYFINQFDHGSDATNPDHNIASEITAQFKKLNLPMPTVSICGPGTGVTATIQGKYFQWHGLPTKVILGDPENSVFYSAWQSGDRRITTQIGSRIGGIGRQCIPNAFDHTVVTEIIPIPDAKSIAARRFLREVFGLHTGGSTGTNFAVCLEVIERMRLKNETGSVLMIIGDQGALYDNTYDNEQWLKEKNIYIQPYLEEMYKLPLQSIHKPTLLSLRNSHQEKPTEKRFRF